MKNGSKLVFLLSAITAMVFSGTVSATYAWFELLSEKSVSISGQAGANEVNLEVGIVSKVLIPDSESVGLTLADYISSKGEYIYFSKDKLESASIKEVLKLNGYAYDGIYPVTSYSFNEDDDFVLYDAPIFGRPDFKRKAKDNFFMHLDLVFRAKEDDIFISNSKVYLEKFVLSKGDFDSVRVHIKSNTKDILFNPSSREDGSTDVGGRLDLNGDGYYDFVRDENNVEKEIYYGEKTGDVIYGLPYEEDKNITGESLNMNCFEAPNTKKGVVPVVETEKYVSKVNYLGRDSVLKTGLNNTNKVLAIGDENGVSRLSLDIYMEGYDRSNINTILGTTFGADISFIVE